MSRRSSGMMKIKERCTAKLQFRGGQRMRETGVSRYIIYRNYHELTFVHQDEHGEFVPRTSVSGIFISPGTDVRGAGIFKGTAMSFGSPGTMNMRCTANFLFAAVSLVRETGVSRYIFRGGRTYARNDFQ